MLVASSLLRGGSLCELSILKSVSALVRDLAGALNCQVGSTVPKMGSRCVHVLLPGILNALVWDLAAARFLRWDRAFPN